MLFQSFNTIHICSTDFAEAWSPVRQRVAVANAFTRQRYNIIRYRSSYSIFSLSRMRVCIYFIFIYVTLAETIQDSVYGRCFYFVISSPMLRKVLFEKCLKVITHLHAINEPFKFRGRIGLAAGAIQCEHVATRVHLFLSSYRWAFLRYRCNNLRKLLDVYTINYTIILFILAVQV